MPLFLPSDPRILIASKTGSQAITSGSQTDVTDMGLTLDAATAYMILITIPCTAASGVSPGLQLGFSGPASPTLVSLRRTFMTGATTEVASVITSFTTYTSGTAVANTLHTIEGIVKTSAGNGGVLQLRANVTGTTPSVTIGDGATMYALKAQ